MDFPNKWFTLAIASVTLGLSVVLLKRGSTEHTEDDSEMAAANEVNQPSPVSDVVNSMEQLSVGKPSASAPEEVEIPDRDSANHSPSDFLSGNLNSDTHSEVIATIYIFNWQKIDF